MGECICGKKFKTYNGLRSHTYICQLKNCKTTEQNISEIPSQGEMWKMLSKLIRENEKMKTEIQQLRSSVQYQQRKIQLLILDLDIIWRIKNCYLFNNFQNIRTSMGFFDFF